MKKKTAKKRKLTPLEREIKRRESSIGRNVRTIQRLRADFDVELKLLEQKNATHREILTALKS